MLLETQIVSHEKCRTAEVCLKKCFSLLYHHKCRTFEDGIHAAVDDGNEAECWSCIQTFKMNDVQRDTFS